MVVVLTKVVKLWTWEVPILTLVKKWRNKQITVENPAQLFIVFNFEIFSAENEQILQKESSHQDSGIDNFYVRLFKMSLN